VLQFAGQAVSSSLIIRPFRPTDIVALSGLHQQAALCEVTSHTWPKVQPESGHLSNLGLLSQALTHPVDHRRTWVCQQGGEIRGVIVGRGRAGGLAWDVEHLYARENRDASALLDYLCTQAARFGARRVFVEAPAGPRGADVMRRACCERYTSATLFYLPAHTPRPRGELCPGRPRQRMDGHPLFQLYNAAVPPRVRSAEALTYEEWAALYRGRRKWTPSLFSERQQYVWEAGAWLVGWAEVTHGARSQYLELLVHPEHAPLVDAMLHWVLAQLSERSPLYASAREYQPAVAAALERAGFRAICETDIYVKLLVARVPRPALAPAHVVTT